MIKIIRKKTILISIIILLMLAMFIITVINKNEILKIVYPKKYSEQVEMYSEKYNIDDNLIYAVIKAESNFEQYAKSSQGALGLMQLMVATAEEEAIKLKINLDSDNIEESIMEIDINIEIGTKYLANLVSKYDNIAIAVAAYNAGIGTIDTWIENGTISANGEDIENIPYSETNNYVRKVVRDYEIYSNIYK